MTGHGEWSDGRPRPSALSNVVWGRVEACPERSRRNPSRPGKARKAFFRWLKFNLVGAIGIAVQLAALAIFRALLHLNYLLATTVAVEIALLHNFLWHERFTWADRPSGRFAHSLARLARFNVTNGAVSLLGNLTLMWLLVGQMRVNYFAANLIAIAACSLLNFLLSDRLVFDRNTQACDPG